MPHIKNAFIRYRIIDRMLRNKYRPFPSKKEMREACEEALFGSQFGVHICDSTIEKDMFNMKMEHDAPIKYSKLHRGYYYENPDFSINDIPLTEQELGSIKFAVNTLQQFREVPFFKEFGSAIDKIVDRVSVDHNDTQMDNYIQFEESYSTGGNQFLNQLLEAIQMNKKVWFQYGSFRATGKKPRKVSPIYLKEYRNRWYLLSYDGVKKHITTYALDRMEDLEITEDDSDANFEFDTKEYFKYATGITVTQGEPTKVVLKANPTASKYIDSQPFHHSQKQIEQSNGEITFELKVFLSEEFIRELLSYAGEIEIVQPKELIDIINERFQRALDIYKRQ
jgi:predicted DNA-binding transcriptional regulator YafY